MNYIKMTEYLYTELAERHADHIVGFKKLYTVFERRSAWCGVWKHQNSDMEIFGIYADGMKLNLRLNSKYDYEHKRWIKRFKDVGLKAYRDPGGEYWLLVPISETDITDPDKLEVILSCMNSRYQKLKNLF